MLRTKNGLHVYIRIVTNFICFFSKNETKHQPTAVYQSFKEIPIFLCLNNKKIEVKSVTHPPNICLISIDGYIYIYI